MENPVQDPRQETGNKNTPADPTVGAEGSGREPIKIRKESGKSSGSPNMLDDPAMKKALDEYKRSGGNGESLNVIDPSRVMTIDPKQRQEPQNFR